MPIAHRFSGGRLAREFECRRHGWVPVVPTGRVFWLDAPDVETPGYFQLSLRDKGM